MTDDGITLTATEFTVTATETVSTGDYESHKAHTTIKGEIPLTTTLDDKNRRELKARLLAIHKDAQEIVERAGDNRLKVEDAEDWGVYNGNGETEDENDA